MSEDTVTRTEEIFERELKRARAMFREMASFVSPAASKDSGPYLQGVELRLTWSAGYRLELRMPFNGLEYIFVCLIADSTEGARTISEQETLFQGHWAYGKVADWRTTGWHQRPATRGGPEVPADASELLTYYAQYTQAGVKPEAARRGAGVRVAPTLYDALQSALQGPRSVLKYEAASLDHLAAGIRKLSPHHVS